MKHQRETEQRKRAVREHESKDARGTHGAAMVEIQTNVQVVERGTGAAPSAAQANGGAGGCRGVRKAQVAEAPIQHWKPSYIRPIQPFARFAQQARGEKTRRAFCAGMAARTSRQRKCRQPCRWPSAIDCHRCPIDAARHRSPGTPRQPAITIRHHLPFQTACPYWNRYAAAKSKPTAMIRVQRRCVSEPCVQCCGVNRGGNFTNRKQPADDAQNHSTTCRSVRGKRPII